MAALDTNRSAFIGHGISRSVYKLVSALIDWNDARVTRKALSALSDHELDDIGLSRSDIIDAAQRHSRY